LNHTLAPLSSLMAPIKSADGATHASCNSLHFFSNFEKQD
jgi:hypothetical protein